MKNKIKILNDPIYGFITIPNAFISGLINHSYFQRLRRISQMGLSYLVYPGAQHTRFQHALGCMHLMKKAIDLLRQKGNIITPEEEKGLLSAILLHDIGHGPFSHALEKVLIPKYSHEQITLLFMEKLQDEIIEDLDISIQLFNGSYPKKFLCQLVASQLDIDRLDYLKRDSFYTGVSEGNINSDRLIYMFNVVNNELVVEHKGLYSVEKFLDSRQFMYWQVYLHKTGLVAEEMLKRIIKRARELTDLGIKLPGAETYKKFINLHREDFQIEKFALLDDYDIIQAIKIWQNSTDFVLSYLCKGLLNRNLLKIEIQDQVIDEEKFHNKGKETKNKWNLTDADTSYLVFQNSFTNPLYDNLSDRIYIQSKEGNYKELSHFSKHLNSSLRTYSEQKFYICYPNLK